MSLKKCTTRSSTRLIFLSIVCDTDLRRFEVPETKLIKLETLLKEAIQSRFITFYDQGKLAGKCTSMSVAPGQLLSTPRVKEGQPIPKSEILFN